MPRTQIDYVIIDAMNLVYASAFAYGDLSYQDTDTGVIYGFLRKVLFLAKELNPKMFLFAWDSRESKRREIYPDYKGNRKEKKEEFETVFKQATLLKEEILPKIGFENNFQQEGYEADDIIAKFCLHTNGTIYIVSTDQDLYQLLGDNPDYKLGTVSRNKIYNPKTKKVITDETFYREYRIVPEKWIQVKAIAGCKTDNVLGVPKIGEKTAINYLLGELNWKTKAYQNIQKAGDIRLRNIQLVKLPFKGTKYPNVIEGSKFILKDFVSVCVRYGFHSFINGPLRDDWIHYFRME